MRIPTDGPLLLPYGTILACQNFNLSQTQKYGQWRVVKILTVSVREEALLALDTLKQIDIFLHFFNSGMLFPLNFGLHPLTILKSAMESLLRNDQLDKPLANIYKALIPSVHFGLEGLYSAWQEDYPELDTGLGGYLGVPF